MMKRGQPTANDRPIEVRRFVATSTTYAGYSARRPSEGRRLAAYSDGKIVATRQITIESTPVMMNS
jgi:hypothetical protein